MKKILLLSFYIFCVIGLLAQQGNNSSVKGHVLDAQTEEHLPGVTVSIEGTQYATMTDETGHFSIDNIPSGTYILLTQYMGYSPP